MTKSTEPNTRTDVQFAIDNQTCTKSLNYEHKKKSTRTQLIEWSIPQLCKGRGVGVVLYKHRQHQF